ETMAARASAPAPDPLIGQHAAGDGAGQLAHLGELVAQGRGQVPHYPGGDNQLSWRWASVDSSVPAGTVGQLGGSLRFRFAADRPRPAPGLTGCDGGAADRLVARATLGPGHELVQYPASDPKPSADLANRCVVANQTLDWLSGDHRGTFR